MALRALIAGLLVWLTLAGNAAVADPPFRPNGPRHDRLVERPQGLRHAPRGEHDREPRHGLTLDEAVTRIRRETGGRILSAKTLRRDGERVHRIKVLTPDHRVRVFTVDAGDE